MSKRVRFDEVTEAKSHKFPKYGEDKNPKFTLKNNQEEDTARAKHSSHTNQKNDMDSDEEQDQKKELYEKMTEDDVEGAEDDYNGEEVGITPFNLKEEMEEGDFDTQGNYHLKKETIIRDEWLDNIDWMNVKKRRELQSKDNWSNMDDDKDPDFNELEVLRKMVALMLPGETVTAALRRLGGSKGNKKKTKKREWKKEKLYDLEADDEPDTSSRSSDGQAKKLKDMMLELTGLADEMMGAGHYNVYVDTYEKFNHKISIVEQEKKAKEPQIPDDANDDDALDILADSIDKTGQDSTESSSSKANTATQDNDQQDVIKWEYKWSEEDSEVYGPFTSQEMSEWQEQGFFKDGVFVRRTDRDESQFYTSKRIDFELYT